MIRLRQVLVNINENNRENIMKKCSKKLRGNKIIDYKINKQSLDARKKPDLFYSYEIDVSVLNEDELLEKIKTPDVLKTPDEEYKFVITGTNKLIKRPIIVGAGPAGLFCAYMLSKYGYKPIVIERGQDVDKRIESVNSFWEQGNLNKNSNVQFGEGGAGTFSDGKLNSLVKDPLFRQKKVLEIFVEAGAPEEILYVSKPHIGTDLLVNVVKNIREKIISFGGEVRFNTMLTDINFSDNKIASVELNNKEIIKTDILVMAIGHSARDTFKLLYDKKLDMSPKPFAVGVRIQHPQSMINKSQYGVEYNPILKSASYKLTHKASNGRGVYTFCMCPGGYVVNSSSEENMLAINGMSNYKRNSGNANSSVIVTVTPDDFGTSVMDGVEFQRKLEGLAFREGNGKIPVQLYGDFKNNKVSLKYGEVEPIFKGNYSFGNIQNIFPKYIIDSLIEGIDAFDRKIKGYNREDSIIAAVESRTSSPIRIERDENLESNIKGIYPCGEGAGYAGGITSAAMDGIKIAESIAKQYKI